MDTLDTFTTGCSQAWGMLLFNDGSYAASAGRLFCSSRVLACGEVRCCLLACVRGRRSRPSIRKTTRLVLRSQLGHSRNLELLASDRHPISNPVFGRPKVPGRHRPRLEKSRRPLTRDPIPPTQCQTAAGTFRGTRAFWVRVAHHDGAHTEDARQ